MGEAMKKKQHVCNLQTYRYINFILIYLNEIPILFKVHPGKHSLLKPFSLNKKIEQL